MNNNQTVLWIRNFFNADPDPAFYGTNLNVDPSADPGSQTSAGPCGSGSWADFQGSKSKIFT